MNSKPFAFTNVNVVPLDKEIIIKGQTVVVRQGRIAEMGPTAKIKLDGGVSVIDGQDKYLMPGLVDIHTHITDGIAEGTPLESQNGGLLLYVASGVTTFRNMKGRPKHL